jgi:hypothetical protein
VSSAAADRGLAELLTRDVAGADVAGMLLAAVRGRHLTLWSVDPDEQAALVEAGLAGAADPQGADLSLAAMNQFSISKLDQYVDRAVSVDVEVGPERAHVTQQVTLSLDAPENLDSIVEGLGRLTGELDLATALDAELLSVERDGEPVPFRREVEAGSTRVVVFPEVDDGASATWRVRYTTPVQGGTYRLLLLPQPLASDAVLNLDVRPVEGTAFGRVQGELSYSGPFSQARTVEVEVARAGASWWDRPVTIG